MIDDSLHIVFAETARVTPNPWWLWAFWTTVKPDGWEPVPHMKGEEREQYLREKSCSVGFSNILRGKLWA